MSLHLPAAESTRMNPLGFRDYGGWWRSYDWILWAAAAVLSIAGSVLVWSASKADMAVSAGDPLYFFKRHLLNMAIGIVLGVAISRIAYPQLRAYTPFLYVLSMLGLVAVLLVGVEIAGAKAWIRLPGGFTLQPSEFAKVAIILALAFILGEKRNAQDEPRGGDVVLALAVAAVPVFLVLRQNDTGTVLVMGSIIIAMVAVSGAPARWVVGLLAGGGIIAVLAWKFVLKPYQIARLTSFIDPEASAKTGGFNVAQARIAIGNGGFLGQGLFHGAQTQGKFVPVNESDFIFSVVGEELGFLGSIVIIGLLAVVLWRGVMIALRASDLFGRLVATGVVAWIGFQSFENLGMNVGIMPVTGVPLPFISYGGTSMFASWIAIGLLQNVHLRSRE
ncbi:MAG: rod shape-determining protein RodA [Actinobacteria bacterium]|nr:rod shape-determining protein RodA [Actinomycetota bacterium]